MSNPCKLDDTTQNNIAYAIGYEKGKTDGAREFAEWLLKNSLINGLDEDYFYTIRDVQLTVDEVLAEWQKGAELNEN